MNRVTALADNSGRGVDEHFDKLSAKWPGVVIRHCASDVADNTSGQVREIVKHFFIGFLNVLREAFYETFFIPILLFFASRDLDTKSIELYLKGNNY